MISLKSAQAMARRWLWWDRAPIMAADMTKLGDSLDDSELAELFAWVNARIEDRLPNQSAVMVSDDLGLTFSQASDLCEAAGR